MVSHGLMGASPSPLGPKYLTREHDSLWNSSVAVANLKTGSDPNPMLILPQIWTHQSTVQPSAKRGH